MENSESEDTKTSKEKTTDAVNESQEQKAGDSKEILEEIIKEQEINEKTIETILGEQKNLLERLDILGEKIKSLDSPLMGVLKEAKEIVSSSGTTFAKEEQSYFIPIDASREPPAKVRTKELRSVEVAGYGIRNPWVATMLNVVFWGIGYKYLGIRTVTGLSLLATKILLFLFIISSVGASGSLIAIFLTPGMILSHVFYIATLDALFVSPIIILVMSAPEIFLAFDAYNSAKRSHEFGIAASKRM